jgi:hypothetical protein
MGRGRRRPAAAVQIPSARVQIPSGRLEFSLSDSLSYSLRKTRGDGNERQIGETDQWHGGSGENCGGAGNRRFSLS